MQDNLQDMEDYKKEVEDTWDSEEVKGEIKCTDVNNALLDQDLHESKVV